MKRGLSLPLSALFLLLLWLLLNGTPTLGQFALGGALAVIVSLAGASMRPLRARPRRPLTALVLCVRVVIDIVRSNIAVAGIIFGSAQQRSNAAFMRIPLELRDPHGLAVLACIITATPGTVWAGLSPDDGSLTLHVLDLQDEELWTRTIKQRYERPLMEIFE